MRVFAVALVSWHLLVCAGCGAEETRSAPAAEANAAEVQERPGPPTVPTEIRYPGHEVALEGAAHAALVFVGVLVDPGVASPDAPGEAFYAGARVRAARSIAGDVSGEIELSYIVRTLPAELAERAPSAAGEYLFFVEAPHPSRPRHALKILEHDSALERRVRMLRDHVPPVVGTIPMPGRP